MLVGIVEVELGDAVEGVRDVANERHVSAEEDVVGEVLEAMASRGEPEWPSPSERDRTVALYERLCDDLAAQRPS